MEPIKYIAQNERDEQWGLTVCSVGYQKVGAGEDYPPQKHNQEYLFKPENGRILSEYQLLYIVEGQGSLETRYGGSHEIRSGDMFLLFPGEWHNFAPDPDTGWDDHWVGFNGSFMDDKIRNGFFTFRNCVFRVGVNESMVDTFHEILDIAADEKKGYQQLIASLAISLIGRIHYEDTNHTNGDTYIIRVINQAKTVMREDMDNQPLEDIAQSLGISYSLFRREFRKKCGISPGQYRLELKLAKAKELLYSTNISIAEISSMLHFECIGQFSTFFKKRTGIPPHEFRKQGAKKD